MPGRFAEAAIDAFARLLPASHRDGFAGDLREELAFRERTRARPRAIAWLIRQLGRSAPPLVWSAMARTAWLSTFATAFAAYVAVGLVEFCVNWALTGAPAGGGSYRPLGMLLTFPAVVLIAFAAARYRRGAPWVLGSAMLLSVALMTLTSSEVLPAPYRVAYFFVGPTAVVLGALLNRRTRPAA